MDKRQLYVAYIYDKLKKTSNLLHTHLKFHKLLYFSWAYNLAHEKDGFDELYFEAWENGPVETEIRRGILYENNGLVTNYIKGGKSDFDKLTSDEKEAIDKIVSLMGDFSSVALSKLTHDDIFTDTGETPWKQVNKNGSFCCETISKEIITSFYDVNWFNEFENNIIEIKELMKNYE